MTPRQDLDLAIASLAVCAHADVTVTTLTSGKAAFIDLGGEGVNQIKGTRQRTDQAFGGKMQSLIIDIDGRRFVSLDAKKKSAIVTPLDSIADELQKVGVGTMDATLTENLADQADRGLLLHGSRRAACRCRSAPRVKPAQGMDLTMMHRPARCA